MEKKVDWKHEYEHKCLELEKAEEILENYVKYIRREMMGMSMKVVRLHQDAELPVRAHPYDAGADVKAVRREFLDKFGVVINENDPNALLSAVQVKYYLGIGVEVPKGYMLMAACKSSVYKTCMVLANCMGVIDFGYQGEVTAIFNLNQNSRPYHEGDPVCQLILVPIVNCEYYWGQFEGKTERGEGGYGSTGNLFSKEVLTSN